MNCRKMGAWSSQRSVLLLKSIFRVSKKPHRHNNRKESTTIFSLLFNQASASFDSCCCCCLCCCLRPTRSLTNLHLHNFLSSLYLHWTPRSQFRKVKEHFISLTHGICVGGLVVAELAGHWEVLGSFPATSELFSRKPAVLKSVWCQNTQKKQERF